MKSYDDDDRDDGRRAPRKPDFSSQCYGQWKPNNKQCQSCFSNCKCQDKAFQVDLPKR